MAYVRRRGGQLALVQGERDPQTQQVEQRVLFTFYSQAEAREALGRGGPGGRERFQQLLEGEFPDISFDWKAIRRALADHLAVLPETYEYRSERLSGHFRRDLCAFTRQLVLADPQHLLTAAQLLQEHRRELEFLQHLIGQRLQRCDQQETEWNRDNVFYWRSAFRGRDVPADVEEHAAGLYERGDYAGAEVIFRLLCDCFAGYADGYNYLGLIAVAQEDFEKAIAHFQEAVELGRRLFPRRIAKDRYEADVATRPYLRGLRNLSLTLLRAGQSEEALALCGRLADECGDVLTAQWHRAAIYLSTGRFQEAADAALSLHEAYPAQSLLAALALVELGRSQDAVAHFLHGALNHPEAARRLLGLRATGSVVDEEERDTATSLHCSVQGYLSQQRSEVRRFFVELINTPQVAALLAQRERAAPPRSAEVRERQLYTRSLPFARQVARALFAGQADAHQGQREPPRK